MKKAVYFLSGDFIHQGDLETIYKGINSGLFNELSIYITSNPAKNYLFDLNERVFLAKSVIFPKNSSVKINIKTGPKNLESYKKSKRSWLSSRV